MESARLNWPPIFLAVSLYTLAVAGGQNIHAPSSTARFTAEPCRAIFEGQSTQQKNQDDHLRALSHDDSLTLVPAFRVATKGAAGVECLVRGIGDTESVLYPVMRTNSSKPDEVTGFLPPPSTLGPGSYAVRCVQLFDVSVSSDAGNLGYRWPRAKQGPGLLGKEFKGEVSTFDTAMNGSVGTTCYDLTGLLGMSYSRALQRSLEDLSIGACQGLIVEANAKDHAYGNSGVSPGLVPAVIRIVAATPLSGRSHGQPSATIDSFAGQEVGGVAAAIQRCGSDVGSLSGRWLPLEKARGLVINGGAIPASRLKYWVPFGCRPTYWDLAALKTVAAAGGDTGCAPPGGGTGSGAAPVDGCSERLRCHLPSLRHVVFTGSSTAAVLFSALRETILGQSEVEAHRNKEVEPLVV